MKTRCCGLVILVSVAVLGTSLPSLAAFRFAVTGDTRGSDNGVNAEILGELAAAFVEDGVVLALVTGDLVQTGAEEELEEWVDVFMAPLLREGIRVFPGRGNHDLGSGAWGRVFSGDYALPDNGPDFERGATYWMVHENALFISLDQYVPWRPYQVNQAWLDEQLSVHAEPHVFLFGHNPAFSVRHSDSLASFPHARDVFWDSIGRAGGCTYFCGHDHFYNHAQVQDSAGNPIHQYVVGTGGAPIYAWDGVYADSRVEGIAHVENYGYVLGEVDGLDVRLVFKERAAPGVYAETGDVLGYTSARTEPTPAEPSLEPWAIAIFLALLIRLLLEFWQRLSG